MARRTHSRRSVGLRKGFRSGLEETLGEQLSSLGVPHEYESFRIPYVVPARDAKYTPDFLLLSNGIVLESKGRFDTADRQKHLLIKEQHPDLDLRFIFSNSRQRISKVSKTTYGKWCDHHGFLYADRKVPREWIDESPKEKRMEALRVILEHHRK